jgi:hypothetical protein
MPRDSIAEMGKRVGEEGAPEKVGQIVIPAHVASDPVVDASAVNALLPLLCSRTE